MKYDLIDRSRDRMPVKHSQSGEGQWAGLNDGSEHTVVRSERIGLTHILRPEINLAVWQRDVPSEISIWLSRIRGEDLAARPRDIDRRLPAGNVATALLSELSVNDPIARAGVASLARDAKELAHLFAQLSGCSSVRLRLDWVAEQRCPRVHADRVSTRLLCTYRGAGTEWISNDVTLSSPHAEPCKDMLNRLGTGDVAIMKGSLDGGASPLRHRSPPLNDPDEWRLLLSFDPLKPGTSAIDCKKEQTDLQRS